MAFAEDRVNEVFPGSTGGVIEVMKRSVITAFRSALTGTTLTSTSPTDIHVDLEYPDVREKFPAIWVQFSLGELSPAGHGMVEYDQETNTTLQEMMYRGRVSLTILALTSMERDRLADFIISALSFSRIANPRVLTDNGFTDSFSRIYQEFHDNPYLSMTVNSDSIRPGGQSVTVGAMFDERQLVYEDNYNFDVVGQFQLLISNEGLYRLRRIDIYPEVGERVGPVPGEWQ